MNCRVCKKLTQPNHFTKRYNKTTNTCIECSNERAVRENCEHNTRKHDCVKCIDPIHRRTLFMLKTKAADKNKNRQNDLTYDNVKDLILNSYDLCAYCGCDLQHNSKNEPKYSSIERIDESKGHIIDNCIIACLECNTARIGKELWSQNQ
jgi:hypothetical protein